MKNLKKLAIAVIIALTFVSSLRLHAEGKFEFQTDETIYVVADIHGAFKEFSTSLQKLALIDESGNWVGGASRLVSTGDLVDRGPESRKVIDLMMRLEEQAMEAGGRVHVLLGNHEVMNLIGDLRYVSNEEYAEFQVDENESMRTLAYQAFLQAKAVIDSEEQLQKFNQSFPPGYFAHRAAYQEEGIYGQWLMGLPFIIKINDHVFVHGGLPKHLKGKSIEQVNGELKADLTNFLSIDKELRAANLLNLNDTFKGARKRLEEQPSSEPIKNFLKHSRALLFSKNSPTWYRGNAICHPFFEEDILNTNLQQWSANQLWVGHTQATPLHPTMRLNNQLVMMDTGMLESHYKGTPWLGKIAQGEITFISGTSGETAKASTAPNRFYSNPYGLSDAQVEDFLKNAEVIDKRISKEGKTKPFKVELERDGKKIKGLFKYKAAASERRGGAKRNSDSPDRFKNEMAAYKLDRMLGIGLVPVTVERLIHGKRGTLQLWVNDLVDQITIDEKNIKYDGYCDYASQINLMDSFDYLIANFDRNQSNVMFNKNDFQIWFIDHSMAFGRTTKRPPMMRDSMVVVTPRFKRALESLTEKQLETLKPWLSYGQIKSIWDRRNKMLADNF